MNFQGKHRSSISHLLTFLGLLFLSDPAGASSSAAIIDFQFPLGSEPKLEIHPLQEHWLKQQNDYGWMEAFYPNFGGSVLKIDLPALGPTLFSHARNASLAYRAGRTGYSKPFLLNISSSTPNVMRVLIREGVRIFSMSIGIEDSKDHPEAYAKVIRENPETIFVVAAPHKNGSSLTISELNQIPSALQLPNVILAGCLANDRSSQEAHLNGNPLGSRMNPYEEKNLAANSHAEIFMLNCEHTRAFVPGFGGTSAAAPHLASLFSLAHENLIKKGISPNRVSMIEAVRSVLYSAHSIENSYQKNRKIKEVRFFTIDTILGNSGERLIMSDICKSQFNCIGLPIQPMHFR